MVGVQSVWHRIALACATQAIARMQQLKKQQDKKEQWRRRGHGEYQFLANEKEFFACMKGEDKMVCHFFRSSLPCRIIDQHINKLCQQHLECKFAKVRPSVRRSVCGMLPAVPNATGMATAVICGATPSVAWVRFTSNAQARGPGGAD